jgi:hypothetical protein
MHYPMRSAGLFLLIALQACAATAAAEDLVGKQQCAPEIVALAGKHAGVKGLSFPRKGLEPSAANGGLVAAGVCKAWPGDPSRIIAALAYDAGIEREKQLLVALIDAPRSTVIAAYSGVIEEDAGMTVGPYSLRLDTANYQLAPGVRAFGLDIDTGYHQGCVSGGSGPDRTLFVQEGKTIRPVLQNFSVSSWRYLRGGPSCVDAQKDELIETTEYSIDIAKPVHHGFSSLRVTARRFDGDRRKPHDRPRSLEVHYDGQGYPRPSFDELR